MRIRKWTMRIKKINFFDFWIFLILTILTLVTVYPILNTVAISFSDKTSAALGKVFLWPVNFNYAAYEEMIKGRQYFISFGNSAFRTVLGTFVNVLVSITMAYPLSKDKSIFPARNIYMWFVVFNMLFNGGLVPNFILVKNIGIMDSIWALVLPGAVPAFSVIMLMNFFKGIPKSLEEAALMDGANPLYVLINIIIPLSKPAIATISLFAIVGHWNAYFDGMMYINTPTKMPLQTYIQAMRINIDQLLTTATIRDPRELERLEQISAITFDSAKVIVAMAPLLLIYPFLQRYFTQGIVMGAVKE